MKYKKEIAASGIVIFSIIASVVGYNIFGERLEHAVPVINTLSPERMSELGLTETSKADDSDMWEETKPDAESITETAGTESSTVFPLDINLADLDDLMQIKGIGKVTAQSIISYRDDYGYFYSLDELLNVSGIGEKKLADLKKFVYISDEFAAEAVTTSVFSETYTSKRKNAPETTVPEKTTKSVEETKKSKTVKTSAEDEEIFEDEGELIEEYVYNNVEDDYTKFEYTHTTSETEYSPSFPLELNRATVQDLVYIKGIGKTMAQRIVDYGRKNGYYSVEDLLNVSGIGESTLNKIAPYVYADSSGLSPKSETTETEYFPTLPIELNSASVRDLVYIKGISENIAQRIVDYGRINGFYEVDDLLNVNGIGESTLKKIAPYVYADSSGLPPKNEYTDTEYDPPETITSESDFYDTETSTSQTEAQIYKVNINTATKEDFMQLPGIDETTAENLIQLREDISGFQKIEEMIYADGMTTDKIEIIREYIYL